MATPNAGALWLLLTLRMLDPHGAPAADHRGPAVAQMPPPAQSQPVAKSTGAATPPLVVRSAKARPRAAGEKLARLDAAAPK